MANHTHRILVDTKFIFIQHRIFTKKKRTNKNTKPKNFTNENKLSQKIVCKSITLDCYSRCEYTKQAIVNA